MPGFIYFRANIEGPLAYARGVILLYSQQGLILTQIAKNL